MLEYSNKLLLAAVVIEEIKPSEQFVTRDAPVIRSYRLQAIDTEQERTNTARSSSPGDISVFSKLHSNVNKTVSLAKLLAEGDVRVKDRFCKSLFVTKMIINILQV